MLRLCSSLLVILLSCHSVVGPFGLFREACYWSDFTIPSHVLGLAGFHRQSVFFTPARSNKRIQVMLEDGTVMDPHYEISSHQFKVREVTERDEGHFTFTLSDRFLTLKIKDCPKEASDYGTDYFFSVPPHAYSLEFTLTATNEPRLVLWNRVSSSPQASGRGGGYRGRLENNKWIMEKLTQEHNGYYTIRDRYLQVISRNKITVAEQKRYFMEAKGQDLQIVNFRMMGSGWFDLTFNPTDDPEPVVLMKAGELLTDTVRWKSEGKMFAERIQKLDGVRLQINVKDLQLSDSGCFKLTDQQGNLALVVTLNVVEKLDPPYIMYTGVATAILIVVVVCCCWVRQFCKITARKEDFDRQTEAAPTVYYYHQDTTQPSSSAPPSSSHGPTYSFPLYPKEPGSTYHQALVASSTASHGPASRGPASRGPASRGPASRGPASRGPASRGAASAAPLYPEDTGAQYELRGVTIPSAPPLPLSLYTPYWDVVYTTDKLNFL